MWAPGMVLSLQFPGTPVPSVGALSGPPEVLLVRVFHPAGKGCRGALGNPRGWQAWQGW